MSPFPYETPDVYIAAFLLSQGAKFISVTRVGRRRNIFRFESSEMLHELLRLYWRQDPYRLAPAQLFAALRRLKSVSRVYPGALHRVAVQLDSADNRQQSDESVPPSRRDPGTLNSLL
jgi:hypothetical protein